MTRSALSLLLLFFLVACTEEGAHSEASPLSTRFPLQINEVDLSAQIAIAPVEQERGLMFRESMPANEGMLFPYTQPRRMSFWMRNTPLPLDIAFFDRDGVLREVYPLRPYDETRLSSRSDQLQYALEMNRGWFRENGILPGAQLDLALLAEGLRARGEEPVEYGIEE